MAQNDIKIINQSDALSGTIRTFKVDDRTTSSDTQLLPGEPVAVSGNFVAHVATATPTITAPMVGVVVTPSTETDSADGEVQVFIPNPGNAVMRINAHTPGNLALGILNDCVTFDLTSTTYTINEDEGSDPNVHGLEILDYDATAGTVDFTIRGYASEYFSST